MKTKLVYVLTCDPEATYIEQALMAIWSARYWNPDAHIVLLTDNKTSEIIHTDLQRGEILKYISEEVVSSFESDKSMHYRSRWIKTKARELVSGDMLFIDCDTICCRSLESVDSFDCEVGAVLESHLPIKELNQEMQDEISKNALIAGWTIQDEEFYYSSGVIYAKDTLSVRSLYNTWHSKWKECSQKGISIDQPAFAYANIQLGHIISQIPASYNCILFTQPQHTREAHILHIASFRNPSVLFEKRTLLHVRKNGMQNEELRKMIVNPCTSFHPFEYDILHSTIFERIQWIKDLRLLENGYFKSIFWMIRKRIHVIRHRKSIKANVCQR